MQTLKCLQLMTMKSQNDSKLTFIFDQIMLLAIQLLVLLTKALEILSLNEVVDAYRTHRSNSRIIQLEPKTYASNGLEITDEDLTLTGSSDLGNLH